jgi:hypothetical protein
MNIGLSCKNDYLLRSNHNDQSMTSEILHGRLSLRCTAVTFVVCTAPAVARRPASRMGIIGTGTHKEAINAGRYVNLLTRLARDSKKGTF